MYSPTLFHLDLCTLSYHIYSQSLAWPFDPFYESLASPSNIGKIFRKRREMFMESVRKKYLKSLPNTLDAILHQFDRIDPSYYGVNMAVVGQWQVFHPQKPIMKQVGGIWIHEERKKAARSLPYERPSAQAQDELHLFTGRTGMSLNENDDPFGPKKHKGLPSIMGYLLYRKLPEGGHTLHIIFRGSRSGWLPRVISYAVGWEQGNPDWVTDLQATELTPCKKICLAEGASTSVGFSSSFASIWPQLRRAFLHLAEKGLSGPKMPPKQIFISGHSLGGALATVFAASMATGKLGQDRAVAHIDWGRSARLITYGAPTVGNPIFSRTVSAKIWATRMVVSGDLVATESSLTGLKHIGQEVLMPFPTEFPKSSGAAHSIPVLRTAVLKELVNTGAPKALKGIPGWNGIAAGNKQIHELDPYWHTSNEIPWVKKRSLFGFYKGRTELKDRVENYLNLLASTLELKSSYSTWFSNDDALRKEKAKAVREVSHRLIQGEQVDVETDLPWVDEHMQILLKNLQAWISALK